MTAVFATADAPAASARVQQGAWWQSLWHLSKRAFLGRIRQPALLAPSFVFPLFFAALSSASFGRATQLPNFPKVDSFLDMAFAGAVVQGVLFGCTQAGADLALDIEQGFYDRLVASPVHRSSIVLGRLGGAFAISAIQVAVFMVIFTIFGVSIKGGPVAILVLPVAGGLIGVAFGSLMTWIGIRTGSSEAVQGAFPLLFISLFMSSAFFPRETMHGWFKTVADINPVSHLVEGVRYLVIRDFELRWALQATLIPLVLGAIGVMLSLRAHQRRLGA